MATTLPPAAQYTFLAHPFAKFDGCAPYCNSYRNQQKHATEAAYPEPVTPSRITVCTIVWPVASPHLGREVNQSVAQLMARFIMRNRKIKIHAPMDAFTTMAIIPLPNAGSKKRATDTPTMPKAISPTKPNRLPFMASPLAIRPLS